MKKIVLFAAFMVAMTFAACGNKTVNGVSIADSTAVDSVDTVQTDTIAVDSTVAKCEIS